MTQIDATGPPAVDVGVLIDAARLKPLHLVVFLLGLSGMVLEGYDTYAVSYVGPQIAAAWNVPPSIMGIVFTSGIVGSAIGYMAFGPVADRLGRRAPLIAGALLLGLATLASITAGAANIFMAWRVVCGLGLGAMLPNLVSLAAEFAPSRFRSVAIVVLYSGFAIGSAAGGLVAGGLAPAYGWKVVFVVGGAAPMVLAGLIAAFMPESPRYLALRQEGDERLARILARLGFPPAPGARFRLNSGTQMEQPIGALFNGGRAPSTLLIWLILTMNVATIGSLVFWIPSLAAKAGASLNAGINVSMILLLGGIVGAAVIGACMDRLGLFKVLIVSHLAAVVLIVAFALSIRSMPMVLAFLIGCTLNGGTSGTQGLLARLYPTPLRATGIGWASGVSRLLGIGQPLLTGLLLSAHWSPAGTLIACAVPIGVSTLGLVILSSDPFGRGAADPNGEAGLRPREA